MSDMCSDNHMESFSSHNNDRESWDSIAGERVKTPDKIIEFFNEIDTVCKKYGFSISHEDSHGAFIIEDYDELDIEWLRDARLEILENFPL